MSRSFLTLSMLLAMICTAHAELIFSTGNPDGLIAAASRIGSGAGAEIEAADDFVLLAQTTITSATFNGLIPSAVPVSGVNEVTVEIYRVFPLDSAPADGHVPTRTNSPSDVAFDSRDSAANKLSAIAVVVNANFNGANSVLNGINPSPNYFTGGEGPISGTEIRISATFNPPIVLPPGHYFFVPQVLLSSGTFMWLSAPRPIVAPGTPFTGDLQAWIRNANLDPDWLRIGTDIVGGATTYSLAFSLSDDTIFRNGFD
jgi:hypothetical protein